MEPLVVFMWLASTLRTYFDCRLSLAEAGCVEVSIYVSLAMAWTYIVDVGTAPVRSATRREGVLEPLDDGGLCALFLRAALVVPAYLDFGTHSLVCSALKATLPLVDLLLTLR